MKQVIALLGLPGSGKTTAASFFKKKNIPVVRMGKVTDKLLKNEQLSLSEKNERKVRSFLRAKFGEEIYAKLISRDLKKKLEANDLVIIDGIRSVPERIYFAKKFKIFKVICIDSGRELRFARITKREVRSLDQEEFKNRDVQEIKLGFGKLKKSAEYIIKNNSSRKNFLSNLEKLLTKIKN